MFDGLPQNHYGLIMADPPWRYSCFTPKGEGRSASRHYKTMKLPDIVSMPVVSLAAKNCHLFLWTTSPNLEASFEVMRGWGFKYSSMAFTWVKLNPRAPEMFMVKRDFHVGMGHTTRKNAEFCLLGRKGSPKRLRKDVREIIIAPRRQHSRKPDEAYERAQAYAKGPYLDLFSREDRPNWDSWGNETGKFAV